MPLKNKHLQLSVYFHIKLPATLIGRQRSISSRLREDRWSVERLANRTSRACQRGRMGSATQVMLADQSRFVRLCIKRLFMQGVPAIACPVSHDRAPGLGLPVARDMPACGL